MYKYFISYNFSTKIGTGFGYCECVTDRKIEDFEHLKQIAEEIKEKTNYNKIIILNYKLLKEE